MSETVTHNPGRAAAERAAKRAERKRAQREHHATIAAHVLHGLLVKRTYGDNVYNQLKPAEAEARFDGLRALETSINQARGSWVHPRVEVAPEKLSLLANAFHDKNLPASEDFRSMVEGLFGPTIQDSLGSAVRHDVTKKLWQIAGGDRATGEEIRTTSPVNKAEVQLLHSFLKVNDRPIPGAMEALAQAYTAPRDSREEAEAHANALIDQAYGVEGMRARIDQRVTGLMRDTNPNEGSVGEHYINVVQTVRAELADRQSALYAPAVTVAR